MQRISQHAQKILSKRFLQSECLLTNTTRNTFIMTRTHAHELEQRHKALDQKHVILVEKDYVYKPQYKESEPCGNMEVLLATDIEGIGMKGDVRAVSRDYARKVLFPARLVEYMSPENIERHKKIRQEQDQSTRHKSMWAKSTIRKLAHLTLPVPMSPKSQWVLTKQHVRVAFRHAGIVLSEDSITLPGDAVNDIGPVTVDVCVNDIETVSVQCVLYHWYTDEEIAVMRTQRKQIPVVPALEWNHPPSKLHVPDDVFHRVNIG